MSFSANRFPPIGSKPEGMLFRDLLWSAVRSPFIALKILIEA
jgi:hypothetical protein